MQIRGVSKYVYKKGVKKIEEIRGKN